MTKNCQKKEKRHKSIAKVVCTVFTGVCMNAENAHTRTLILTQETNPGIF